MQVAYLPIEIWAMISKYMTDREWAVACGTCPTTYKLRQRFVAAKVIMMLNDIEQGLARQLQLDKWPACHSLCLSTRFINIYGAASVTEAQIKQIQEAGRLLPLLQCLHIIGSYYDDVKAGNSVQALLIEVLAKHVSVLTLEIYVVGAPLDFPNLQHLVLHMLPFRDLQNFAAHCPELNELINLKTLYLQSEYKTLEMRGTLELRGCARLQHVALQNLYFEGPLTLPSGCLLHVFGEPELYNSVNSAIATSVSGLTLRHSTEWALKYPSCLPLLKWAPMMRGLKVLRLILSKKSLQKYSLWDSVRIDLDSGKSPCLEVLEVVVHSSLSIHIDPRLPLRSIIVATAGHLVLRHLSDPLSSHTLRYTLKELYFQSGAPLLPAYNVCLERYYTTELGPQMRLSKSYKGRHSGWTMRMPITFTPSNMQKYCCNACPECLAQAGVPIMCDNIWTREGFDKHVGWWCYFSAHR